jgi:hypothetical protein
MTKQIAPSFVRPLTSKLSPAVIEMVAYYSPCGAVENLVHAWLALTDAAACTDVSLRQRHLAYANLRADCADSEPCRRGLKPRQVNAFEEELRNLRHALLASS